MRSGNARRTVEVMSAEQMSQWKRTPGSARALAVMSFLMTVIVAGLEPYGAVVGCASDGRVLGACCRLARDDVRVMSEWC